MEAGPLFTKRTDVLPQELAKSRSREIRASTLLITMKFNWHLCSTAAKIPVKSHSETIITSPISRIWGIGRFGGKAPYRFWEPDAFRMIDVPIYGSKLLNSEQNTILSLGPLLQPLINFNLSMDI